MEYYWQLYVPLYLQIVSFAIHPGADMDRLSAIFNRFFPSARTFFSGSLCRQVAFDADAGVGHIHILRSGQLQLTHDNGSSQIIEQPSVLFYPHPKTHAFAACGESGPELLCASIDLGLPLTNPLAESLPELLIVPLKEMEGIESFIAVLFAEAFAEHCGRQLALDHLISYFLILLLRHVIDRQQHQLGLLAGLSDPKLSKALTALHEQPHLAWNLERLADQAGMSRARFAEHFRLVVGLTPMEYATRWRMGVTQTLLKQGYSIKQLAPKVGYQSAAALTRTFTQRMGIPPSEWLQLNQDHTRPASMDIGLGEYSKQTG